MAFNLIAAVESIAPTLATMLGGPFLGQAVTSLEGALGLQPGEGIDGITKVMQSGQMTPEMVGKIRAEDQRHAEVMQQQKIDLVKINLAHQESQMTAEVTDRASARERQVAVKDRTPAVLAWLIILASLALTGCTVAGYISKDPAIAGQIGMVTGYLLNESKSILAYYFGSSRGSDDKTAVIAGLAQSAQ